MILRNDAVLDRLYADLCKFGSESRGNHCCIRGIRGVQEENETLADYVEAAADLVGQFSRYLREKDFGQMLEHAENAARRRPELLFGGMLIAGLATARFLKSSRKRDDRQISSHEHHNASTGSSAASLRPSTSHG